MFCASPCYLFVCITFIISINPRVQQVSVHKDLHSKESRNAFLPKYLLLERSSIWGPVWVLSETKPYTPLRLEDQTPRRFKSRYRVSSGDCLLGTGIKSDGSAASTAGATVYYFPCHLTQLATVSEFFQVVSEVTCHFYLCREVQAPNREESSTLFISPYHWLACYSWVGKELHYHFVYDEG